MTDLYGTFRQSLTLRRARVLPTVFLVMERRMGFEPTFSCLRSRAPRPLEDRRVGAVHRSRTDTLWVEVRDAAVEHQHRFVWGGAGNRTLALTSTASRAATDTSATVVLVWALGFEPRTSSVRGRCSGQAELHPVGRRSRTRTGIIRSSGEGPTAWTNRHSVSASPFRLSALVVTSCPPGEAGIRPL